MHFLASLQLKGQKLHLPPHFGNSALSLSLLAVALRQLRGIEGPAFDQSGAAEFGLGAAGKSQRGVVVKVVG
jgi:hypothetical protein